MGGPFHGGAAHTPGSYGALRHGRRAAARGVTLVEVLIVVAIMAVISGGVTLVAFPIYKETRIKLAVQGCQAVRNAAELYQNLEATTDACPTIQDLVSSKKLDGKKISDPWGMDYNVVCAEGEIHGVSAGNDRKFGTQDDVRDDFKDVDVKRVKGL